MSDILWWVKRGVVALLLGAVVAALTGSAVLGTVATGLALLVVASVAWEAHANPGNAADDIPHGGAAGAGPGDGGGFDGGSGGDGGGGGGG